MVCHRFSWLGRELLLRNANTGALCDNIDLAYRFALFPDND